MTRQLEEARNQIRSLEEELERAKELAAIMANMGQGTNTEMELVELGRMKEKAPNKEAS